jgi:hypothetical protein
MFEGGIAVDMDLIVSRAYVYANLSRGHELCVCVAWVVIYRHYGPHTPVSYQFTLSATVTLCNRPKANWNMPPLRKLQFKIKINVRIRNNMYYSYTVVLKKWYIFILRWSSTIYRPIKRHNISPPR